MITKPLVLVLCTGNSCRSHLAEGILRQASAGLIEVSSAGSKPAGFVHPKAIGVMKEIGIDISGHRSKHLNEFLNSPVDTVITVCGNADQACPTFPGQMNRYHWGFDDPAHAVGSEETVLNEFRRVRDQIRLVFEAYAELRTFFRSFDPRHEREHEIFTRLGYIDVKNLAPRIQAKVLMGLSLMDTICPPSTQFAVYNQIKSEKECAIYPDFAHETLPGFSDLAFNFLAQL